MTERKTTRRARRTTSAAGHIPRVIAEWFGGDRPPTAHPRHPWIAVIPPHSALLPEYWLDWCAENPGAAPPAGFEWLGDPDSPRQHVPAWMAATARQMLRRQR